MISCWTTYQSHCQSLHNTLSCFLLRSSATFNFQCLNWASTDTSSLVSSKLLSFVNVDFNCQCLAQIHTRTLLSLWLHIRLGEVPAEVVVKLLMKAWCFISLSFGCQWSGQSGYWTLLNSSFSSFNLQVLKALIFGDSCETFKCHLKSFNVVTSIQDLK